MDPHPHLTRKEQRTKTGRQEAWACVRIGGEFKEPVQDPAPQVLGQPCNYIYQGMGMGLKTHCGVARWPENMEASLVIFVHVTEGANA